MKGLPCNAIEYYSVEALGPPSEEPLDLATTKLFLREDQDANDPLITEFIQSAREKVEQDTGRTLVNTQFRATFNGYFMREHGDFPPGDPILFIIRNEALLELPKEPAYSIDSINIIDDDGSETLVDASNYILDKGRRPPAVWLRNVPIPQRNYRSIEVNFTAGHGPTRASVPSSLRDACRYYVAYLYEREVDAKTNIRSGQGTQLAVEPPQYLSLISKHKIRRL